MKLGAFQLSTVSGGRFRIDGGTMFGVVPRSLWSRVSPPDDENRVAQATNCVLIETGGRKILIDTGYGSKLPEKQRQFFTTEPGDPLADSLAARGVSPEQIDTVILSHLHFDHAGGATRRDEAGELVAAFPRAECVVQRREWETAVADLPELRGAYPPENLWPLENSDRLRLIDGDAEIVPGIRAIVTGGHTQGHMALLIESEGETAVYLGDICPTWRHLPTLWCMAYDIDLLRVRRIKPLLLGRIADNGWWALSDHDPEHGAAKLARDDRRDFAVTETLTEL